jgi:hypothetical protein
MKKLIISLLLLVSHIAFSQKKCTLIFDNGMSVKDGFVDGGVQLTLPAEDYEFYIYGDRNIVGIERFDSIAQYRGVEKEFLVMYQDKLCDFMNRKGESCGDTEVAYEINNSPMFGYCNVIYFYYESAMFTNSIRNMWIPIGDGNHTIFILTHDGIYYQRRIILKNGKLVEL